MHNRLYMSIVSSICIILCYICIFAMLARIFCIYAEKRPVCLAMRP